MATKSLAQKMNMKAGHRCMFFEAPENFTEQMGEPINETFPADSEADFILAFAADCAAVPILWAQIVPICRPETILWFAYPKKSGKIKSDIGRDTGWELLSEAGYLPVSAVSADENYSALRFKPAEKIKNMQRGKRQENLIMPEDFAQKLEETGLITKFTDMAFTHRLEILESIHKAKKAETRKKRIAWALSHLEKKIN